MIYSIFTGVELTGRLNMMKRKPSDDTAPEPKRLKLNTNERGSLIDRDEISDYASPNALEVFCRVRPSSDDLDSRLYEIQDWKTLKIHPPDNFDGLSIDQFEFTRVFDSGVTQEEIARVLCYPVIENMIQSGHSALIFAYGITNAGKTHTILGNSKNSGMVPRALQHLCSISKKRNLNVVAEYFEIYNDNIYDLLKDIQKGKPRQSLKIRQDSTHMMILNLTQREIHGYNDAMKLIEQGVNNRKCAETSLNQNSSRSHSVFRLVVSGEETRSSKLCIVDLAGAERNGRTNTVGERLKEAGHINNSLSVLGRCLEVMKSNQIKNKQDIIPFRDTKLTRIFQEYFTHSENSSIKLIININPCRQDFEETLQALKFSALTVDIKPIKSKLDTSRHRMSGSLSPVRNRMRELESLIQTKDQELNEYKDKYLHYESNCIKMLEEAKKLEVSIKKIEYDTRQKVVNEMQEMFDELENMYKSCNFKIVHEYEEIIHKKNEIHNQRIKTILESKSKSMKDQAVSTIISSLDSTTNTECTTDDKKIQTYLLDSLCEKICFDQVSIPLCATNEHKEDSPENLSKTQPSLEVRPQKRRKVKTQPFSTNPVAKRTRKALLKPKD